jgi:hypothetical protein
MKTDRPSHEEFLAELAALDKVLRSPAEPSRPPMTPPDLGFAEHRDLVLPPPDAVALRASAVASPPPSPPPSPPRRLFVRAVVVRAVWAAVLSGGFLTGGYLGWSLTTRLIDQIPQEAPAAPAPATTAPAGSRAARPGTPPRAAPKSIASNATASNAAGSSATARNAPASNATARNAAASRAAASHGVVPSAAAPGNAFVLPKAVPLDAAHVSGMIAPVSPPPAIAPVPLTSAPLRSRGPVLPNAPAPTAAARAMAAVAADQAAIAAALRQYEQAYERLDAKAAVAVWPTVDQRALSRAFAGLSSQTLDMRGCEVVVRAGASTATASCRGTAEYVRKVGDTRVRVEPREWTFTLNKTEGEWRIGAVDGHR